MKGDKNAKDFILFFRDDYRVLRTEKDNTGRRTYIEGMVFPTLSFPSDHGTIPYHTILWVVVVGISPYYHSSTSSSSLYDVCMYVCRHHLDGVGGAAVAGAMSVA